MTKVNQFVRIPEQTLLEEHQQNNLTRNWKTRLEDAVFITQMGNYALYSWTGCAAQRVFYIVHENTPLAYIATYVLPTSVQITSVFMSLAYRRQALMFNAYKAIIAHERMLVSDWDRTPLAEALWQKLILEPDLHIVLNDENRYEAQPKQTDIIAIQSHIT